MKSQTTQTRTNSIIYRASFVMMAAAVCDQLEKAGIPAAICDINDIYCVCVPTKETRNSLALLNAEPRQAEILYRYC